MINYSNYFKKTINSENLDEYRRKSGKHNLSLHFDGKQSWGEGYVIDYGGRVGGIRPTIALNEIAKPLYKTAQSTNQKSF